MPYKDSEVEILLVEDNKSDAEMAIRALTKNKVSDKIVHLNDGAEALEFIFCTGKYAERDIRQLPKLILLDLKMPKVNGIEVLERLKSDPRTMRVPVVILTSSKENPDLEKCYAKGANSYIVKPVEFVAYVKAVAEMGNYWTSLNQLPL